MSTQPEAALRLADVVERNSMFNETAQEAAAELRRLHTLLEAEQALHQRATYPELRRLAAVEAQRDALLEALREIESATVEGGTINNMARAAIKAVEEGK